MTAPVTGDVALTWLLLVLASFRLWRLLALDGLPLVAGPRERARDWIEDRHGDDWADGIACAYCLGFHCVLAVFGIYALLGFNIPIPAAQIAAASAAVGLLAQLAED